jgi:hypothetical protein
MRSIAASLPASGGLESSASFSVKDVADLQTVGYSEVRASWFSHSINCQDITSCERSGTLFSSTLIHIPFLYQVDVMNLAALEQCVKGVGRLKGLAYAVGSINLKPLKATTTEDFVQVHACFPRKCADRG